MTRTCRIAAILLAVTLAASLVTPQPARAFGGAEIASIVITGVMALPLVIAGIVKLVKKEDDKPEKKATEKPAEEKAAKPSPVTVSPDQIFEN